jgi:hypothetical protein
VATQLFTDPDQRAAEAPDLGPVHSTCQNIVAMLHDLLSDGLGRDPSRYKEQERSFREFLGCLE